MVGYDAARQKPATHSLTHSPHDVTGGKSFVYNAEDLPQSQIIRACMFVCLTDRSCWSGRVCLITRSLQTNKITVRHDLMGSAFCSSGSNHIFGRTRFCYRDAIFIIITWPHLPYCLHTEGQNKLPKNKAKKKSGGLIA